MDGESWTANLNSIFWEIDFLIVIFWENVWLKGREKFLVCEIILLRECAVEMSL